MGNIMEVITIVGGTGQGKTPYIKQLIKGKNCLIFDVNNEYGLEPYNGKNNRSYFIGSAEEFIRLCFGKRNTACVFEEATGFLGFNTQTELKRLIVNKKHVNNYYIFVFHDVNSVPKFIRDLTDKYVLFKTFDIDKNVQQRDASIYPHFKTLQGLPDHSFCEFDRQYNVVNFSHLTLLLGVSSIDTDKKIG